MSHDYTLPIGLMGGASWGILISLVGIDIQLERISRILARREQAMIDLYQNLANRIAESKVKP